MWLRHLFSAKLKFLKFINNKIGTIVSTYTLELGGGDEAGLAGVLALHLVEQRAVAVRQAVRQRQWGRGGAGQRAVHQADLLQLTTVLSQL